MNTNASPTAIEQLAANAIDTRFEDLDPTFIETTKLRIIDTLGCAIGGYPDTGNPEMIQLYKDQGGKPEATILVDGTRVPVINAGFVNSILARSFDFEPVSPIVDGVNTPGHVSGTTVPTALAVAEATGASGHDMMTALIVGDDIAARILAASGFGFSLGWDGVGTVNCFGATAIAGRLMGLDKHQLNHAFGLVLNMLGTTFQSIWDATMSFKLAQGLAAQAGILSAQLAKTGWTGAVDALHSQFGYYNMFTAGCKEPHFLTDKLGEAYYADAVTKPYPGCRIPHAAEDCILKIMNEHGITADTIANVNLDLAQGGIDHKCGQTFELGEYPHGTAAFSYHYVVACSCLRGSVKPEHYTEKAIRDPEIAKFIEKITLTSVDDVPFEGARVTITTTDGNSYKERVDVAKGNPIFNPISNEELLAKFWTNVEFSGKIGREKATKALSLLEKLEKLDDVRKLVPFLVA